MARDDDRINGWKAIGAHFGRDRTTAMRWARERGMPVRSLPGGKTRTVYASRAELTAWAARPDAIERQTDAPSWSAPPHPPHLVEASPTGRHTWTVMLLSAAILVALLTVRVVVHGAAPRAGDLPENPRVAVLYLHGRDAWAQRTASGLAEAVTTFERVTRADPGFAPAFAALADANLLMREYGATPPSSAHAQARAAARRAIQLDPNLPAAWRALGFIAYWLDHDRAAARADFRRALALNPADAQTHFWYADVLTDNGDHAAALRQFDEARLRDPGSIAIRTERAWLLWSAGRTAAAKAEFAAVARERPDYAVLHECLSMIALVDGDFPGHLRELEARARSRGEPRFNAYVEDLRRALRRGGVPALREATLRHGAVADYDDAVPALYASVGGDRTEMLRLLRAAEARHETWGWSGYRRWMAWRWRRDREVTDLLARRAPAPLEPGAIG